MKLKLWFLLFWMFPRIIIASSIEVNWAKIYKEQLFHLTEIMVTDVASPPVAARIYAYSTLSSYLVLQKQEVPFKYASILPMTYVDDIDQHKSMLKLKSPEFSAIYAILKVGEEIMPSGYLLQKKQEIWIQYALKNKLLSKKEINSHIEFANQIVKKVLELAKNDGYLQLSTLTRYTPITEQGSWHPTPPAYIEAVEPHWKTIKPFFLENLNKFEPAQMTPFDLTEKSEFHQQLIEVYTISQELTEEQKLIANFWDCNPFKVDFKGHMAIGIKKISPGGHWMGITGIASEKKSLSLAETSYIHALVGMALHDAFISCWKSKYETNRIRPESVINQHLDQRWKPILQTPPFPEYTSGHSVISQTSAVILTHFFGSNFEFIDDSEVYFGLPKREFKSFLSASEEAAISRLYGGIHFRDAIEAGQNQGAKIGEFIWNKIQSPPL
jgi:hypothetical protein